MPAVPGSIIEPVWNQISALLPTYGDAHPLGCHRPRIPDRLVFDKLVQVLVFGCAYHRIADASVSATTLRRRRDAWIVAGVMQVMLELVLVAYERMIGLELAELAVECCITKAPCGGEVAGRSPVDRGKQGLKRSLAVDAAGIPLGTVAAPANRHDAPLLGPTLDALAALGSLPDTVIVNLDHGYDSDLTRERLAARKLAAKITPKGKQAPIGASQRWPGERTNAWTNAHKKLVWCTERRRCVIDFWLAFSAVIVIVRRLVREGWMRYRWDGRPARQP